MVWSTWDDLVVVQKNNVQYKDSKSSTHNLLRGVSQSSVLGPIPFIVYANDLPNSLKTHSKSILFATDTIIYLTSNLSNYV